MKNKSTLSKQTWFALISGLVIVAIALYAGYTFFRERTVLSGSIIHRNVSSIVEILRRVDTSCDILSIRSGRNPIDFLQVEKFVGSEIGPLNLAHPDNWEGPYVQDNYIYDSRPFDLVATKRGFYVVPGHGSRLPNGSIMGKDVLLTYRSNIDKFLQPGGSLHFNNQAFAQKLDFVVGDWDARGERKEQLDELQEQIKDIEEQLPYTQDESALELEQVHQA